MKQIKLHDYWVYSTDPHVPYIAKQRILVKEESGNRIWLTKEQYLEREALNNEH